MASDDLPAMWLTTVHGFYSVVQHRSDPEQLIVRARTKEDIEALRTYLPDLQPYTDRRADYRWRAVVTRAEWVQAVAQMVAEIDYPNFKAAVGRRQGSKRATTYGQVWKILLELQSE
jgi:hypothetical protein